MSVRWQLVAAALASLPGAARAQASAGAPVAAPPSPALIDASTVRPGRWTYRLTILRGGLPSAAGERVVTVQETTHGGTEAWAIAESRRVATGVSADSVVASRASLAPLHWEGTAGGARLAAGIARDTLYGAVAHRGGRVALVARTGPGAVLSAAMLEVLVAHLPLATGASWTAPLVLVGAAGVRVAPATIVVGGEERLTVPAGTFDCLRVVVRVEAGERVLWVSRDGRGVVRSEERMPDLDSAVLEQALAASGPP